ncbi:hypothetical protein ACHAWF_009175 [Thalassiosira exigua]
MMRSVMSSISRDRTELAEARRGDLFADENRGGRNGHGEADGNPERNNGTSERDSGAGGRVAVAGDGRRGEGASIRSRRGDDDEGLDDALDDEDATLAEASGPSYEDRCLDPSPPLLLPYGSSIVLRPRRRDRLASISLQPREVRTSKACFAANEAHGAAGGVDRRGENRFVVVKSDAAGRGGSSLERRLEEELDMRGAEDDVEEDDDPLGGYLCYGDTVALRSGCVRRVLGVQKDKRAGGGGGAGGGDELEVGCFRREGRFPKANAWTVLRGGAGAPAVRLGTLPPTSLEGEGGARKNKRRIPVYSGDPVALKNEWTGGLLSLGEECRPGTLGDDEGDDIYAAGVDDAVVAGWSLKIVTSSYEMNEDGGGGAPSSATDRRPLIEHLHEHDVVRPREAETFAVVAADVPPRPDWTYRTGETGSDRTYLLGSYPSRPERHARLDPELEGEVFPEAGERGVADVPQDRPKLAQLSAEDQEAILLDEVLGAMMGHEGRFLRYYPRTTREDYDDDDDEEGGRDDRDDEPGFGLAPPSVLGGAIDPTLENVVHRLLPLCTNYVYVRHYVASALDAAECGAVARALCEAIDDLLSEYLSFVAELDRRRRDPAAAGLTLSDAHVRSRPAVRTVATLSDVAAAARDKRGGALLNALRELQALNCAGDGRSDELLDRLQEAAAAPYADMLRSWLTRGRVHDPHGEFMIEITDRSFLDGASSSPSQQRRRGASSGVEWTNWCRERGEHVPWSLRGDEEDAPATYGALGVDRSRATSHMSAMDRAHATGKYWRAIRCCRDGPGGGGTTPTPVAVKQEERTTGGEAPSGQEGADEDATTLLDPLRLSRRIDRAYHEASDTLLRALLDDRRSGSLLPCLRFVKRYFLLDQGDFFVDFLDGAEDELVRDLPDVRRGRVQNRLKASVARTSPDGSAGCPLAAALRCGFQSQGLRDTLDDLGRRPGSQRGKARRGGAAGGGGQGRALAGFEAVALELTSVPFPASVVLSHKQLRVYQLVFRLVFHAKYVERRLVGMWSDHQMLKGMGTARNGGWGAACGPTFGLRRRMLHFVQNFVRYLKFDVIEPGWRELEEGLNAARERCLGGGAASERPGQPSDGGRFPRTVDDLVHQHNEFLLRVSGRCLLTEYDLIDRASKIMTTCLLFSTQIGRFMETTGVRALHERTRLERSRLRHGEGRAGGKGEGVVDRGAEFRRDRDARTKRCADDILRELRTGTYRHMIARFDEVFSAHLAGFVRSLDGDRGGGGGRGGAGGDAHMANLAMQLDYNGFVSSSMAPDTKE